MILVYFEYLLYSYVSTYVLTLNLFNKYNYLLYPLFINTFFDIQDIFLQYISHNYWTHAGFWSLQIIFEHAISSRTRSWRMRTTWLTMKVEGTKGLASLGSCVVENNDPGNSTLMQNYSLKTRQEMTGNVIIGILKTTSLLLIFYDTVAVFKARENR